MPKKIKWVEVEVSGNASSQADGNCTTFYSEGGQSASVAITNTLGKKTKVNLKSGAKVEVCDDTGVATVNDGT